MITSFTIPGTPCSSQSKTRSKHGGVYTDTNSLAYGWQMRVAAAALQNRPSELLDGPLGIILIHYRPRPKRKTPDPFFAETGPDQDNIAKIINDGMQGIIVKNDSRICFSMYVRQWTDLSERVDVTVGPVREMLTALDYRLKEASAE